MAAITFYNPASSSTTTMGSTTPPPSSQIELRPSSQSLEARISLSPYTPFQKSVWLAILQIPAGSVTTYAILSAHLKSSPRAVGNALRRNPFAPAAPCHRVVATGGALGGFKGKIARRDGEGITLREKVTLLRKEGVRFDEKGKVRGTPFVAFV